MYRIALSKGQKLVQLEPAVMAGSSRRPDSRSLLIDWIKLLRRICYETKSTLKDLSSTLSILFLLWGHFRGVPQNQTPSTRNITGFPSIILDFEKGEAIVVLKIKYISKLICKTVHNSI
jgi:hypothetical protein